jgi:hypothetical protein
VKKKRRQGAKILSSKGRYFLEMSEAGGSVMNNNIYNVGDDKDNVNRICFKYIT